MKDHFSIRLGQWLAAKRKEAKLSQEQAAKMMNCRNSRISNWENGIRDMSAKELMRYCEVINADLRQFIDTYEI